MLPLIVLAAFIAIWTALSERARRKLADRVRADWGSPHVQDRKMDAIAEYTARAREACRAGRHSTIEHGTTSTWMRSSLRSTVPRARSASRPSTTACDQPRSQTTSMRSSRSSTAWVTIGRPGSIIQMALRRLRDPAGYDLWWLAQPGAIERQPWHVMFPIAALTVFVALLATPIWHGAVLIVISASVINLVVRGVTAPRVRAIIASFRQIGPLISAAEACRFLAGPDVDSIVACLHDELPRLRRLKLIASWAGREPSVSGDIAGAIIDYLNLLFLLDVNAVYFGAGELNATRRIAAARHRGGRRDRRGVVSGLVSQGGGDLDSSPAAIGSRARRVDRAAAPAGRGRGGKFHYALSTSRRARHRFQHVGKVDVHPDARSQRCPGTDDQYLPRDRIPGAGVCRANLHRPIRRSARGQELLSGRGRSGARARGGARQEHSDGGEVRGYAQARGNAAQLFGDPHSQPLRDFGRPRGYYRKHKLSRIALRDPGSKGLIPGLVKSSW